jgi:protein-ribulosamine 3-kinase
VRAAALSASRQFHTWPARVACRAQVRLTRDPRMRKEWERLLEATDDLATLFEDVTVKPSILHGDLWSGNIGSVDGKPCIYDPAVYYGHHEAE